MRQALHRGLIGDVRWSTTRPGNTAIAAQAAFDELGLERVLMEPILSHSRESCELYFCNLNVVEYYRLQRMALANWMEEVLYKHIIALPDICLDLPMVRGVTEFWLYFRFAAEHYEAAMSAVYNATLDDSRFIIVAASPLPSYRGFRRADPTGRGDFVFVDGSFASWLRHWLERERTVALTPGAYSAYKTIVVP